MTIISAHRLAFRVGITEILGEISFALEEGDRLGIVGVNGSGKSTLLKLLTGEYAADEGEVFLAKGKTVGILHQDDAFNLLPSADGSPVDETVLGQMYAAFPDLCRAEMRLEELQKALERLSGDALTEATVSFTALHDRYIEDGGLQFKNRCRSLLLHLGFDESRFSMPVSSLSGGQRTRLALARLLAWEPDVLLLDEPTNHLDMETMAWLEGHLTAYRKTVMVVSHDRYFLDRVTNKTLDVEHGRAKLYRCAYSDFAARKPAERAAEWKHYENQQREIARIEAYIEQQRRWNRERNIIAAESRQKALDRMVKLDRPSDAPEAIRFSFSEAEESGNDVLEVRDLAMSFGSLRLYEGLSFEVKKGDRLLIVGPNGTGKSTLIKLLCGQMVPQGGRIEFGYHVRIGYYDQENLHLRPDSTVLDELWDAYPRMTQTEVRSVLAMFSFRGEDIEKKVSVLSGGERARLTLAKLILSKVNLLVLDEPTNHLDIDSREALENALLSFGGTIIAVSHDRYFIRKLATRMLEIRTDGCSFFRGDWDAFLHDRELHAAQTKAEVPAVSEPKQQKDLYLNQKEENARRRKLMNRRRRIAERISLLEAELEETQRRLFGEAATDYKLASELDARRNAIEEELMALYEEEESLDAE